MVSRTIRFAATIALGGLASGCASPRPHLHTLDQGAVVRGDQSREELALVFTGGEFGEGTGHILDVLRRTGIHASFFVTGDYLAQVEQRGQIREMVTDGHYVGPHSDTHPLYCAWEDRQQTLVDQEFFKNDLANNIADLRGLGALPEDQPVYFVPPYEWFNRDQVAWAARMDVCLFNFTPGSGSNRDWIPEGERGFAPSQEILADVLAFERSSPEGLNGFLLLLHLGSERRDKMHPQLEPLVRELTARGYAFVRVDELLALRPAPSAPLTAAPRHPQRGSAAPPARPPRRCDAAPAGASSAPARRPSPDRCG